MKVLYLTPGCFDKGGISRYCRYQISALREILGAANVRVLSLLGPTEDGFEERIQVDWHGAGISNPEKIAFVAQASKRALLDRPDLILTAHVNFSSAARGLSFLAGAETILNCYGLEVWSGLRPDAAWGLRRMSHVISDCHFTAKYLSDDGYRLPDSTSVIWDCVDLVQFFPGKPRLEVLARYGIPDPNTGFNILTLGRLSPRAAHKGYDRLLEVFAIVAGQNSKVRLIYGGQGELHGELSQRAEALGLSDRVFFTGGIHEDDLADVYRSAHLFSLVSDRGFHRGEGIPLTPLESASSGVPILVGDQDGSQEAVEHGENGFVVPPFDLKYHAGKISYLASRPDECSRMGKAARAIAERKFSYLRFVEEHRRLLETRFGLAPNH